ncbi:MAG: hypothetical protein K2I36_02370 [Ureaplasma sp.]|nr:hypothetical protein [Ureaplasma sp.]
MNSNQLFLLLTLLIILIFELIIDTVLLKINIFKKTKIKNINSEKIMDIFRILIITISLNLFLYIPKFYYLQSNNVIFINFCYIPLLVIISLISTFNVSIYIWTLFSLSIIGHSFVFTNSLNGILGLSTIHLTILLILGIIIYYLKLVKNEKISNFLIIFSISILLIILVAIFFKNYEFQKFNYLAITLSFVIELIFYYGLNRFIPFIQNLNRLDILKKYEKHFFYSFNVAQKIIKEKIKQNNLQYGLVMIFDYINISKLPILWGNSKTNEIKKIIIDELLYAFKDEDVIFFITLKNEYAAFIPLRNKTFRNMLDIYKNNNKQIRPINDPFCDLQLKLLDIPKIISFNNKTQKIYTGMYSSIYGIHSCDINELIEFARYTKTKSLTNKKGGIILDVFDPLIWSEFNIKNNEYEFNQYFNSNNIAIKIVLDTFNKINIINFHVSYLNKLLLNYNEIKIYANNKNVLDKTIRLIAMESLKQLKKYNCKTENKKINLQYPINYVLSYEFSIHNFKEKINLLNIQLDNLILDFDLSYLSSNNLNKINFLNLKNLKNNKCIIKFSNFNLEHLEILSSFQPDWISLSSNSKLNNFKDKLEKDFNINVINHW